MRSVTKAILSVALTASGLALCGPASGAPAPKPHSRTVAGAAAPKGHPPAQAAPRLRQPGLPTPPSSLIHRDAYGTVPRYQPGLPTTPSSLVYRDAYGTVPR